MPIVEKLLFRKMDVMKFFVVRTIKALKEKVKTSI
jgi:hypothetical protein